MGADAADANGSASISHDELMDPLRETFTRLDRWRMVIASRAEPLPGSELAGDDRMHLMFLQWARSFAHATASSRVA